MRPLFDRVQIAERVIDKMIAAALAAPKTETGEAMVGIIRDGKILILDTISPDHSAMRLGGMFEQGDEYQDEVFWWMCENWSMKRQYKMVYDQPLEFVGDWHKQPGSMVHPSNGDFRSAKAWMHENEWPFLLVPIVTRRSDKPLDMNTIILSDDFRLDMWYLTPESTQFEMVMTTKARKLPDVAPVPWHLARPELLENLVQSWRSSGFEVTMAIWNADNVPPLEVCFMLQVPNTSMTFLIALPHDYPNAKKQLEIRVTNHDDHDGSYDSFALAWEKSVSLFQQG